MQSLCVLGTRYNPVRGDEHGIDGGEELFVYLKKLIQNNYSTLKSSFLKLDEVKIILFPSAW